MKNIPISPAQHVTNVVCLFDSFEAAVEIMEYFEKNFHFDDEDENRKVFYDLYDKIMEKAKLKM